MVFCDLANRTPDCVVADGLVIEKIAREALRVGGQIYLNGELAVLGTEGRLIAAALSGSHALIAVEGSNGSNGEKIVIAVDDVSESVTTRKRSATTVVVTGTKLYTMTGNSNDANPGEATSFVSSLLVLFASAAFLALF